MPIATVRDDAGLAAGAASGAGTRRLLGEVEELIKVVFVNRLDVVFVDGLDVVLAIGLDAVLMLAAGLALFALSTMPL